MNRNIKKQKAVFPLPAYLLGNDHDDVHHAVPRKKREYSEYHQRRLGTAMSVARNNRYFFILFTVFVLQLFGTDKKPKP